jgi:glycosyltransferase involved in cell wall biosynthesis
MRDFYRNSIIDRVLVIPHPRYERHREWYPDGVGFARDRASEEKFLHGLTHLLIFENAFCNWRTVELAKRRGVKFAICIMYEWSPKPFPVAPDLVICPSLLDLEYTQGFKAVHMTVPVTARWRKRERAMTFCHNAGHGQVGFAKGTPEVIEAMRHVKSGAKLRVHAQPDEPRLKELLSRYGGLSNVEVVCAQQSEEERYAADVMVNAERYNGLSLPLQEAFASGMLVCTTDRFPANAWLPREPLIPFAKSERFRVNHTEFDRVTVDPREIARVIDEWHGREIGELSEKGRMWGEANGWSALGPRWKKLLEDM